MRHTKAYPVGTFDDLEDAVRLARRLLATAAPRDHPAGRLRVCTGTDGDAVRYLSVPVRMEAELAVDDSLLCRARDVLRPVVPGAVARMSLFEVGDSYLETPLTGDLLAAVAVLPPLPVLLEYDGPIPRQVEEAFLGAAGADPAAMVWEACWPAGPVHGGVQLTINTADSRLEERTGGHAVHLHLPTADRDTADLIAAAAGTTVLGAPEVDW